MSDPFAQALHDFHFDEMLGPLVYRRGEETEEVGIEFYFDVIDGDGSWLEPYLDGPLLDMGAGAGRHALYFQEQFETVAIEQNEQLVEVLRDRGVKDARQVNMFNLQETFEENRFKSAIALGTQVSLSRSMQGLTQFLDDLAYVTRPNATAIIDGYDPEKEETKSKLDYYTDRSDGLAYRLLQMEYDGMLGEPWLYRLFTPERFRDATNTTDWEIVEVRYATENLYQLALEKQ
ncbi:methyltransferase domain-containing protein [Haladaptatus cibarius]|uniref:methyltransferase domain-containing protein n=1 Tax=Haladaptatus cibarius TaxID=453847 RepID=UPI000679C04D|nr:methyltransferase domain-containing protein [Haladaptatus cibarius]